MMKKEDSRRVVAFIIVFLLALSSIAHGNGAQIPTNSSITIAKHVNNLGVQLYLLLSSEESNNLVFSPFGLTLALGITQLGARGNSLKGFNRVLYLNTGMFHDELKQLSNEIIEGRNNCVHVEMKNMLFVKDDLQVSDKYKNKVRLYYRGEIQRVKSMGRHNDKFKEKRKFLKDFLMNDTKLVLVNQVWFKAHWELPFSVFKRSSFFIPGHKDIPDKKVKAAFMGLMSDENQLNYFDDDKDRCQVLEMNYGKDLFGDSWDSRYSPSDVSMVIVLPYKDQPLRKLEENLSTGAIDRWISKLKLTNIDVSIPKFKIDGLFDAAASFQELGVHIGNIRSIWQETTIGASETGTRTDREPSEDVSVMLISNPKKTFHAERPFLFFVRDKLTNTMMFMGRVVNPNKK